MLLEAFSARQGGPATEKTHRAENVIEVPNFLEDGAVVAAAKKWNCTSLSFECRLKLVERIGRLIGRDDSGSGKNLRVRSRG